MTHSIRNLLLGAATWATSQAVAQAQSQSQSASITLPIEKLSAPKGYVPQQPAYAVKSRLGEVVEKTSPLPDSLAYFGPNPVLTGFLTAYKEHRPIVLSPDMVWLLINQGFARHIVNNAEVFRAELVGFEGKQTLRVGVSDINLGDPMANWEQVFPVFSQKIAEYTGPALLQTLTSDFSTTTPTTRIASQITVMEAVKPYFEYEVVMTGCGLPSVTLEGSPADWQQVLAKTQALTRYRLGWWTSELAPLLKEFVRTAEGHGSRRFWMNMVKAHTKKQYGSPTTIDGWLIKFYPYTGKGERTGFKPIQHIDDLAPESVEVPFKFVDMRSGKTTPMAFWAGFVGQRQDKATYALRPEIAWAILNKEAPPTRSRFAWQEEIDDLAVKNLTEIPADIYSFKRIGTLRLSFLHGIVVPTEMSRIQIKTLYLNGQLAAADEAALLARFPNTKVYINGVGK